MGAYLGDLLGDKFNPIELPPRLALSLIKEPSKFSPTRLAHRRRRGGLRPAVELAGVVPARLPVAALRGVSGARPLQLLHHLLLLLGRAGGQHLREMHDCFLCRISDSIFLILHIADGKSQVRQCLGFVQLIHRPTRTENRLYKNPNIA